MAGQALSRPLCHVSLRNVFRQILLRPLHGRENPASSGHTTECPDFHGLLQGVGVTVNHAVCGTFYHHIDKRKSHGNGGVITAVFMPGFGQIAL